MREPLFIGEAPGAGYDPEKSAPLFPYPTNSAGHRLWKMTGLSQSQYIHDTLRLNLMSWYESGWDKEKARAAARNMERGGLLDDRLVVLCGTRVWAAFTISSYKREPLDVVRVSPRSWRPVQCWLHFPHPSGRNRWYNVGGNRLRAEEVLRDLLREWMPS